MKKISIILLAFVFILILSSCGRSNEKETIESLEKAVKEIPVDKIEKTSTETLCDTPFAIEGINDAKGLYIFGTNESWTIHFYDEVQDFVAFYTKDVKRDDAIVIEKIEKISDCEFKIILEGISGEMVPSWILKYNSDKKFYDLYVRSYDAGADTWSDKIFKGSKDNG